MRLIPRVSFTSNGLLTAPLRRRVATQEAEARIALAASDCVPRKFDASNCSEIMSLPQEKER